jgi:hypothetical protein
MKDKRDYVNFTRTGHYKILHEALELIHDPEQFEGTQGWKRLRDLDDNIYLMLSDIETLWECANSKVNLIEKQSHPHLPFRTALDT